MQSKPWGRRGASDGGRGARSAARGPRQRAKRAFSSFQPPPSSPSPQAIDKYTVEKDIAAYVKREFDRRYSPTWHCVVGRNFGERARKRGGGERSHPTRVGLLTPSPPPPSSLQGSFVTHETKCFIYFYLGQTAVLLFKSG